MTPFVRRAAADQQGAAAVEFALLFPVLFMLQIGAAEVLEAYQAQRAVAHIASAMADITAQSRTISAAELDDVMAASTALIHPFPTAKLQKRVSSVSNVGGTVGAPDWTVKKDFTDTKAVSVPAGYLATGESAIVTDVIYDYKPTFGLFMPATIRFTRHAYIRPRLSTKVDKVG